MADGPDGELYESVAAAIATRPALEIERVVYDAGGLAVAARDQTQWIAESRGLAAVRSPLVEMVPLGDAQHAMAEPGELPASGLRVLDLTRVIAGPVGTRMLGALGADVLRVDDPIRPELPGQMIGVIGKSTTVDGRTDGGRELLIDWSTRPMSS